MGTTRHIRRGRGPESWRAIGSDFKVGRIALHLETRGPYA
jgi:hypothetical protein